MLYLVALIVPPLACLLCGKPGQAMLNFCLWCCFIVPGIIHALFVVMEYNADVRMQRYGYRQW